VYIRNILKNSNPMSVMLGNNFWIEGSGGGGGRVEVDEIVVEENPLWEG